MSKDTLATSDDVSARVNILINLMALNVTAQLSSLKEKAILLNRAGLSPKEIASLFGTTPNTVSVALSTAKKTRRRSASKE